jgi:hypothetical protein
MQSNDFRKWIIYSVALKDSQCATDLYVAVNELRTINESSCEKTDSEQIEQYFICHKTAQETLQLSPAERIHFLKYLEEHYRINSCGGQDGSQETQQSDQTNIELLKATQPTHERTGFFKSSFLYHENEKIHAICYAIVGFVLSQIFILPQFLDIKLSQTMKWLFIILFLMVSHVAVRNYKLRFLTGGIRYGTVFKIVIIIYGLVFLGLAVEIMILDTLFRETNFELFAKIAVAVITALGGLFTGWIMSILVYFTNGGKIVTDTSKIARKQT